MRYKTLVLLVATSFATTGFYNPSFDCSNVKENTTEYRICSDEKLSELDRQLAEVYSDALLVDNDAKQAQRQWLKGRNLCQDNECIKKAYEERTDQLQAPLEVYAKGLHTAYLNAEQEYKKSHNVYKTIPLLENAGIRAIVDKRPSFLGEETYTTYLKANPATEEELRRIINDFDIIDTQASSGAKTILYCGADKYVIADLAQDSSNRMLNKPAAHNF